MNYRIAFVFGFGLIAGAAMALSAAEQGKHEELPLPDAAKGFAGMIEGKVVSVGTDDLVIEVKKIVKTWKHSKAKDAASLVGHKVHVTVLVKDGKPVAKIVHFIKTLKAGQEVEIDVNNLHHETLTWMELTKEQREKIEKHK